MEDLHSVGGTPGVLKLLLEEGFLNGDCITCTGKTMAENLKEIPSLNQSMLETPVIVPISNPIKSSGHLTILKGNLAPDGSVAKITG